MCEREQDITGNHSTTTQNIFSLQAIAGCSWADLGGGGGGGGGGLLGLQPPQTISNATTYIACPTLALYCQRIACATNSANTLAVTRDLWLVCARLHY